MLNMSHTNVTWAAPRPLPRVVQSRLYELDPATGKAKIIHDVQDRSLFILAGSPRGICVRESRDLSKPHHTGSDGRLVALSLGDNQVIWTHSVDEELYNERLYEDHPRTSSRPRFEGMRISDECAPFVIVDSKPQRRIVGIDLQTGNDLWERTLDSDETWFRTIPVVQGSFAAYASRNETVVLERSTGKDVFIAPPSEQFIIDGNHVYGTMANRSVPKSSATMIWHADLALRKLIDNVAAPQATRIIGVADEVVLCREWKTDTSRSPIAWTQLYGRNRHDLSRIMWNATEIDDLISEDTWPVVSGSQMLCMNQNPIGVDLVTGRIVAMPLNTSRTHSRPMTICESFLYCSSQSTVTRYSMVPWAANEWSWEPEFGNCGTRKKHEAESDVYCAQGVAHEGKIYLVYCRMNFAGRYGH
ncbi:MAG: PQQ-binding-like beta-propeller repeat protein [Planctomycetota bacterium]